MKSTKFWVRLFVIVFLISCIATAAIFLYGDSGSVVSIYQNGTLIESIRLDTVTIPYHFTVRSENGGYNEILVEPGRICVSDASCPDHVCMNSGWLSNSTVPIVCLPNELVIQLESRNNAVDAAVQ